jgi:hypothetical protein
VYPPKFHPSFLYKLEGSQCVRFLDPIGTNNNPASLLSQFKPTTHANRCASTIYNKTVAVASISAPATYYWPASGTTSEVLVTTSVPHGQFDGCRILFSGCGTMQYSGGSFVLDFAAASAYADVHVIDETHLSCRLYSGFNQPMTNTTTGGSIVNVSYGTVWPLQDMVDLTAAVGATYLHFNAPLTMDTSAGGGAYQVAAFLASAMPAGMKLLLEPGNENWNGATVVANWASLENQLLGNPNGTTYETFNAQRNVAMHEQFLAAFTAAGRGGDVIRVWGGMAAFPYVTNLVLQEASRVSAPIDMLCVGPYFNCWPVVGYSTDQQSIFDGMTADQNMDYTELNAVYGGYASTYIAPHRTLLSTWGYSDADMMAYEWAASIMIAAPFPYTQVNYATRQNAAKRHPRMYGVVLYFLQAYQDAGLSVANWFELGGVNGPYAWDAYETGDQQRGTGNMVADAINVANPQAKNQVLSEPAGALNYWSTLVAAPVITTTTPTKKIFPGRNGRIRSTGFPRGAFRLTSSR